MQRYGVRMRTLTQVLLIAGLALVTGCNQSPESSARSVSGDRKKLIIALMPKSKGNAYFISCKKGADKAARQLGVELVFDGPTDPDPARQNEMIENWIAIGVDVIAAACENKQAISTALRRYSTTFSDGMRRTMKLRGCAPRSRLSGMISRLPRLIRRR